MMKEPPFVAASIRTGAEWIAGAIADLTEAQEERWNGEGVREILEALTAIGLAIERQTAALERLAGLMESKKGK